LAREYLAQCWSCLGEFDAAAAVWCTCSARTPTKLCPFCIHCFCQADAEYLTHFWNGAPAELKEESEILKNAPGSVGEALIRSNLLNTDQLVSALKWVQNRGGTLDAALVELGFVSQENLALVAQGQSQAGATIDLAHQMVDASLVSAISVELCYRKRILPISREEIGEKPVLTLVMAGPTDLDTIDQIQTLTSCRIIPMSAPEKEILDRLTDLFPAEILTLRSSEPPAGDVALSPATPTRSTPPGKPTPAASPRPVMKPGAKPPASRTSPVPAHSTLEEILPIDEIPAVVAKPAIAPAPAPPSAAAVRSRATAPLAASPDPPPGRAAASSDAPGVAPEASAALQKILAEAIARKASRVQAEIRGSALTLFFRVDGTLFRARPPQSVTPAALSRAISASASLPPDSRAAAGRLTVKAGDRKSDVSVTRRPFAGGESLVLRIVDSQQFIRSLEDLGPSALDRDRIRRTLALPSGLVLLSGPPHNGLDSTRYSLLALLAREGRRVLSIDSPRLVSVEGTRQEEVPFPPDPAAFRPTLAASQGAEVLVLPELDSGELAAIALERSATCLVIASVQARRASQTPAALLWHRVPASELAARLKLVVSQRLVRRICAGCRASTQVADHVLKMMGLTPDEALDLKVAQGSGCDACGALSPGYSGRVALFEVMEGTPEIATLIGAASSPGEIEREARRAGMSPLRAACLALVGQGITTLEEFQKGNF
jgi:type II secretory ATPase GspE/PulE/Tfp pilus assembly ATPase PilB-like protein